MYTKLDRYRTRMKIIRRLCSNKCPKTLLRILTDNDIVMDTEASYYEFWLDIL